MTDETKTPEQAKELDPKLVDALTKAIAAKFGIPATLEKGSDGHEMTLVERTLNVMKEMSDKHMQEITKHLVEMEKGNDKKLEDMLKEKDIEVEKALRKGLGLEQDPVIHLSDLIAFGRKDALKKAETDKRTPAPETPLGPEGSIQPTPIDEMFAKAKKGELA